MSDYLPCLYALVLIISGIVGAAVAGFELGRWREQLSLLELLKPQH